MRVLPRVLLVLVKAVALLRQWLVLLHVAVAIITKALQEKSMAEKLNAPQGRKKDERQQQVRVSDAH